MPGAYESVSGDWTVPLSMESYVLLRRRYKGKLRVSTELARWVETVRQQRRSMSQLAVQETAELEYLPTLAPLLYEAMAKREYQKVGTRFLADNTATLLADDPGLGKTLQAFGGILESRTPGPYLVMAPKTAADSVWRREIQRWLPKGHRVVLMPDGKGPRERILNRMLDYLARKEYPNLWVIIHPEIVLVQSYWVCQERIKAIDGSTSICQLVTVEGSRTQKELSCGHARNKTTKKELVPAFPHLFDVDWGAVIIDESHEVLIRRSGTKTQRRRGVDMLKLRGDGMKIAMSGTPFDSKPEQIWGTLNWLDPVTYSAYHRWAELYWQKGGYTGFQLGEFRSDREKMLWDSLAAVALRRTKAEVAKDLPPKQYVGARLEPSQEDSPIGIWLPMDGKQANAYAEFEKTSSAEMEEGQLNAIEAIAKLTRMKQLACTYGRMEERWVHARCADYMKRNPLMYTELCADCISFGWHWEAKDHFLPALPSNKFNWIIESMEEWGYPKEPIDKIVIVSFYTGILNMIGEGINAHFSTRRSNVQLCTAITGQTKSSDRRGIIDRFNGPGGPQVMLLNVKAGGTAITIDSADRMIFVSETRIPDQQKQAEDRIHRVSNPRTCLYYYLRSLGTVDVGTALANAEMEKDTNRLLDERRGVEYVKHLLELGY